MREGSISRKTKETDVAVSVNLDGGAVGVDTGIGFFDHMLNALGTHGGIGLQVHVEGDLEVDCHHTIEDTGIALGQALRMALGDCRGITRFADCRIPMDEALAYCALDVGGRAFLHFDAEFQNPAIGGYDCCMTEEFFRAVAQNGGLTLHLAVEYGKNDHHKTEALYKAFARALRTAVHVTGNEIPSTKGGIVMLAVIDYGVGNLHSVASAFRFVGMDTQITSDAEILHRADGIVLPGVGAFPDAMKSLEKTGLVPVLREEAMKKPLLGICLGMQLLFDEGFEGERTSGLGLIPGTVQLIETSEKLPQIGWNALRISTPCPLTEGLREGSYVYFVHSYMAHCANHADLAAVTDYGTEVTAMVHREHVYGCQFHPEKSGDIGLDILRRFCALTR